MPAPLYEWTGPIASLSLPAKWASTPHDAPNLASASDILEVSEVKAKRLEAK